MMLSKMKRNNKGFTLIELMIVVAIIGILAAIAIPQFNSYRQKAHDSAAKSQLKNLATAMESFYVDKDTYTGADEAALATYGYQTDGDIDVTVAPAATSWSATASHSNGSQKFEWNSASGGLQ
jgi:prepilin-type N-terminal cleavage/methylation domain-containing protein